ncbi:hypothetical protein [Deinococcus roseus]|uniref:Uncharacterized protein n=1 Tax=Deinococcus roseus TaxID=392414 RepID=A0ABQ2DH08_9DEIO|nr:hypothetical protein [Deinococcus roseus]GGJ57737.1 hypothetical protein GCM10008938_49790 [Deinococcus roseus]
MKKEELESHLLVGRENAVCIDISNVSDIPGQVRHVIIQKGNDVLIKFKPYQLDESSLVFRKHYPSLDELILDMEAYLGQPLEHWENHSRTGKYPQPDDALVQRLEWTEFQRIAQQLVPPGFSR